jgi:hypothetical protein
MSVIVSWFDEEQTILLTSFIGQWTWDEVWAAHEQGSRMVKGLDYRVDSIFDLTHSSPFPPPGVLLQFRRVAELRKPTNGITVIVKPSRVVRAIAKVFWLFYPASAENYPFEFADTVAEAYAVLTRHHEEWA